MPISPILTPFDHFHFRPALAVKCIPDLRVCHKPNAVRQYKIVGGVENFGCGALFWEQCALFPCFLWQAGLPPPLYGGIGEVRVLIGNPRRPIWSRCTVSCIIGRPIWSLPGLLATSSSTPSRMHHHRRQPSFCVLSSQSPIPSRGRSCP